MLEVAARHRLGTFRLDVEFTLERGLVALTGPSGAGKSTLINVIAGLIRADEARIVIDGATLSDTAGGQFVPAHRRRFGYIFQEGRLFPHLTVQQNLLYGRWFVPVSERTADHAAIIEMLGIGHLLRRWPNGLSGGEKQRVALGRALLTSPRLLLMDEPLASLDEERKSEILPYIERLRDEARLPIIYVSHSRSEIARLASTVLVMQDGRLRANASAAACMGAHRADEENPPGGPVELRQDR